MEIVEVNIQEVTIAKRVRKNLGELGSLMKSMKTYGLMNPIIINQDYELIAGHRRLEAAKRLGWQTIPAIIAPKENELEKLELEIEENLHRRNLTPDEIADGFQRIEKLRHPNIFRRIVLAVLRFFRNLFGLR